MSEPGESSASAPAPTEHERTLAMLAHLAALAGLVVPLVGNVLGPLAVRLTRHDTSAFVDAHLKEALNFNLTVALGSVLCALLALVFVGLLLGTALFIGWLVLTLIAATRASEGAAYRYPLALRFLK